LSVAMLAGDALMMLLHREFSYAMLASLSDCNSTAYPITATYYILPVTTSELNWQGMFVSARLILAITIHDINTILTSTVSL